MLAVKEDVRERMAAAMALVDAVILLAEDTGQRLLTSASDLGIASR